MRLAFVLLGTELIERFQWVMPLFGAFLIYTGIKLSFGDEEVDPGDNFLLKLVRRVIASSTSMPNTSALSSSPRTCSRSSGCGPSTSCSPG